MPFPWINIAFRNNPGYNLRSGRPGGKRAPFSMTPVAKSEP
jgi:hypothetical protein